MDMACMGVEGGTVLSHTNHRSPSGDDAFTCLHP